MKTARYSDYRTHLTILGLPLVAIANGINPETGKRAVAHGVIAIGQLAKGFVAIGQIAYGVIAIGQIAVGLHFALGQFAVAPLVVGQLAAGFIGVGQGGVALAGVFMGGYVDYGYTMTDLF